eukprot:16344-Hanusia_phi.AAC.13
MNNPPRAHAQHDGQRHKGPRHVQGDARGVAHDVRHVGVVEGVLDQHPPLVLHDGDVVGVDHAGEPLLDGVEDGDPPAQAYPSAPLRPDGEGGGERLRAPLAGELAVEVVPGLAGQHRGAQRGRGGGGLPHRRVALEPTRAVAAQGVPRGALPRAGVGGVRLPRGDEDDRPVAPANPVLASRAPRKPVGGLAVVQVVAHRAGPPRVAVAAVGGVPGDEPGEALGGAVGQVPRVAWERVLAPRALQVRVECAGRHLVEPRVALRGAWLWGAVLARRRRGIAVVPVDALGGARGGVVERPRAGEFAGHRDVAGVAWLAQGARPTPRLVEPDRTGLPGAVEAVLGQARLRVLDVARVALVGAALGVGPVGEGRGHAGRADRPVEEEGHRRGVVRLCPGLPGCDLVGHLHERQVEPGVAHGGAVLVELGGVPSVAPVGQPHAGHRLGGLDPGAPHCPVRRGVPELPRRIGRRLARDTVIPPPVRPLHALRQAVVAVVRPPRGDEGLQRDVRPRRRPLGGALDTGGADAGGARLPVLPRDARGCGAREADGGVHGVVPAVAREAAEVGEPVGGRGECLRAWDADGRTLGSAALEGVPGAAGGIAWEARVVREEVVVEGALERARHRLQRHVDGARHQSRCPAELEGVLCTPSPAAVHRDRTNMPAGDLHPAHRHPGAHAAAARAVLEHQVELPNAVRELCGEGGGAVDRLQLSLRGEHQRRPRACAIPVARQRAPHEARQEDHLVQAHVGARGCAGVRSQGDGDRSGGGGARVPSEDGELPRRRGSGKALACTRTHVQRHTPRRLVGHGEAVRVRPVEPVAVRGEEEPRQRRVVRVGPHPVDFVDHLVALHAQLVVRVDSPPQEHQVFEAPHACAGGAVQEVHGVVVPARLPDDAPQRPIVGVGARLAVRVLGGRAPDVDRERVTGGCGGAGRRAHPRQRHTRVPGITVQKARLLHIVPVHRHRASGPRIAVSARQLRAAGGGRSRLWILAVAAGDVLVSCAPTAEEARAVHARPVVRVDTRPPHEAVAAVPREHRVGGVVAVRGAVGKVAQVEAQRRAGLAHRQVDPHVPVVQPSPTAIDICGRRVERRPALRTGVCQGGGRSGCILNARVVRTGTFGLAGYTRAAELHVWADEVVWHILPHRIGRVPVLTLPAAR